MAAPPEDHHPLNMAAVRTLPTASNASKELLESVQKFFDPGFFKHYHLPGSPKPTQLSEDDLQRAVAMGKFEPCDEDLTTGRRLPAGVFGVGVFYTYEHKRRRRIITEPALNAAITDRDLPKLTHPSRLQIRQSLRRCKYMPQIDFEAFYDSVPLPENLRNFFVFPVRGNRFCRLKTLPTGARWSVAVGQAVTSVIVDIETPVTIHTMIDNILVAARAREGQEKEFLAAVREITKRIRTANLMTSPDGETIAQMGDEEMLRMAAMNDTFLGEEYAWTGCERVVRNSTKTVAKLNLARQTEQFSHRNFVSAVSLVMYATHTTRLNPARTFRLLRAHRAFCRRVNMGSDWDDPIEELDPLVHQQLDGICDILSRNEWWQIADERHVSYCDSDYEHIIYTDASAAGWGALVQRQSDGLLTKIQQQWVRDSTEMRMYDDPRDRKVPEFRFQAQHSAHAEPRAAWLTLRHLLDRGWATDGARIALVTDHEPIMRAQRKLNGFGGVGRGYTLNKLFDYVNEIRETRRLEVTFFHVQGELNPADPLSRNFGVTGIRGEVTEVDRTWQETLPPLIGTRCRLLDENPQTAQQ